MNESQLTSDQKSELDHISTVLMGVSREHLEHHALWLTEQLIKQQNAEKARLIKQLGFDK